MSKTKEPFDSKGNDNSKPVRNPFTGKDEWAKINSGATVALNKK